MKRFVAIFLIIILIFPQAVYSFNPNYIIADNEVNDYQSMSLAGIQSFLEEKGGALKDFRSEDRDGQIRAASEMIYNAAVNNQVSPKLLLVLLQKEQSLIDDSAPVQGQLDWATGYAVCDDCNVNHPEVARFKGFPKQINSAAAQFRYYMDNPHEFYFKKGSPYNIDGTDVIPENTATASLYNYTPHIHGNKNFWRLWQDWFARKFPDGSIVQAKDSDDDTSIYLIQNGKKRKFATFSAFTSRYSADRIQKVELKDILQYEAGLDIKFPQYSLFKSPRGTIYLLINEEIHGIASWQVFKNLGFSPDEVIDLTWEELADYQEGTPITLDSVYPTGALLQNKKTGGVYYVERGYKHPIWSKELLTANFKNKTIISVSPEDLDKFNDGGPVRFKDGQLVTSPETKSIYVISGGQKHPIADPQTFELLGYQWKNVVTTSAKILDLHPTGDKISVRW